MDIVETRRENLRRWVAEHGTPAKEKSLFSQLKSNGSFGERVARRLEEQYRMGAGYLDQPPGPRPSGQSAAANESKSLGELVPGSMRVRAIDADDPSLTQIMKVKINVQAGITGFQVEPEHYDGETQGVPTKWLLKEGLSRDALLALTVRGESMEPSLYEGDVIVVNTRDTALVDGSVYVVNYEGEAVVKRLMRDGQWWLTSDNADQRKYHRKLCKGAECILIGKVIRKESTHI
jgi:phage repressor protein C with HTH and peptisase S24 domain